MIIHTFILPIFNTGKYLEKCIDSALNQGFHDDEYEVLLAYDEGTTDNSLEIAKGYVEQHSVVRLISHSNRSIGESLNYAFPIAKGKYVEVIDTDDYLEYGKVASLVQRMEKENLDILRFDYQNVNEQYEIIHPDKNPKYKVDYSETVTDGLDFLVNRFGYACYVPTVIFRKDLLLREGNEMLPIGINDAEWLPRILIQAERASSSHELVYNYLIREGSKMHNDRVEKVINNTFDVLDCYVVQRKGIAKKWYDAAIARSYIAILSRLNDLDDSRKRFYIAKLKGYGLRPLSTFQLPWQKRIKVFIINISPELFCTLF